MIEKIVLNDEERVLLKQHYRKSRSALIRERAQAILSYDRDIRIYQISVVLVRSEKTIREWIKEFLKERIASIFPHYEGENAAKLTREQKQQIKEVLAQKPSKYGIPKEFWDVSSLRSYISAMFGVEYASDESYRLIFQLHRYTHLPVVCNCEI